MITMSINHASPAIRRMLLMSTFVQVLFWLVAYSMAVPAEPTDGADQEERIP